MSRDIRVELAANRRRPDGSGVTAIRSRGKHIVVDPHQGGGVLGDIAVVGKHDRDRLPDIGHFAIGQRKRPEAVERRSGIGMAQHAPLREDRGEMIERERGVHPSERERVVHCHGADRRMRMRAAHECRMQHAGKRDVIDEAPLAGEERPILEARNACPDQGRHGWALSAVRESIRLSPVSGVVSPWI
jgi:hypothetical protein